MVKRKICAKLREYNNARKKVAKERSEMEEFNDQEYEGVDKEERTRIRLLAVPL
ncbi:5716_t:CDS:2 [Gigaspora rosea]|nr:5716_t:CDS:2 [Gigaspora rosea]